MKTIEKELKQQKQEQKKVPDDVKVKEYVLLIKKLENTKNPLRKQDLINNFTKKYGTINSKLSKEVKKLLSVKEPEVEIDIDEL